MATKKVLKKEKVIVPQRKKSNNSRPKESSLSPEMVDRGYYIEKSKLRLNANVFISFILNLWDIICISAKKFLIYEFGCWMELDILDLQQMLRDVLQEPEGARNKWASSWEGEYMKVLEREARYKGELNPDKNLLNFKNCMLDTQTFETFDHSPEYYSTTQLNINYNPDAKCPIFYNKFMKPTFQNDKALMDVVQELMGLCISTDTSAHVIGLFVGSGRNGKSVLIFVLQQILTGNFSSLSINDIANKFARSSLEHKLANFSTENEDVRASTELLKAISAGDTITAEKKFLPTFSFTPYATLIFACNNLPRFRDKSDGLMRRLKVIPFNVTFTEGGADDNPHIRRDLSTEFEGIMNFCIRGLRRLRKNNYVFTHSEAVNNALKEYEEMLDPMTIFFKEYIEYDPNSDILSTKELIYKQFLYWAKANNHSSLAKSTPTAFWKNMRNVIGKEKLPPLQERKSCGKRCIVGMKVLPYDGDYNSPIYEQRRQPVNTGHNSNADANEFDKYLS